MDQLTFDFDNTDYSIMIRHADGIEWSWKHFKTSLPRQRLTAAFSCQTVEKVGICPKGSLIQCDMASHCHVMLDIPEDDPDRNFGKLCTVCFHDAITKLGEASWRLEDVV